MTQNTRRKIEVRLGRILKAIRQIKKLEEAPIDQMEEELSLIEQKSTEALLKLMTIGG